MDSVEAGVNLKPLWSHTSNLRNPAQPSFPFIKSAGCNYRGNYFVIISSQSITPLFLFPSSSESEQAALLISSYDTSP